MVNGARRFVEKFLVVTYKNKGVLSCECPRRIPEGNIGTILATREHCAKTSSFDQEEIRVALEGMNSEKGNWSKEVFYTRGQVTPCISQ